ncbi:MAG TPA: ATP-binding protein, partial [Acidimicrobiales bacterium]|nr:ATP-binding protein [Acidimicrobiales bacterium]
MLTELRVSNLGVIPEVTLVVHDGMTALTGETGAGKTLLVDAISLLLGGPADASVVRPGTPEALVEGRFAAPSGEEIILRRVVPAGGRSRAYIDGRMASASQLAEVGEQLVDMHGQHGHQALLTPTAQRAM